MKFLLIAALLEALADFAFKWSNNGKFSIFIIGWALYIWAAALWGLALKTVPLSTGNVLFLTINMVIVAVGGVVIFGETLTQVQWLGIAFSLMAILCLNG